MNESHNNQFLKLYEPLHTVFTRYCRAISGNNADAEDLVQETILTVLTGFDKIKDLSSFKCYLFSIAGNLHRKRFRKMRFKGEINVNDLMNLKDEKRNPEALVDFKIMYEKMLNLPAKTSEALILFHISDLSLEDIQKIQGGSLDAVKQRLKRGREKLIQQLAEPAQVRTAILFLNL
jgi:RNA polymerase sigma-70 factor, ECF subfamily